MPVELTAYDVDLLWRERRRCTECGDIWTLPGTRPRLCHYCAQGRFWSTPRITEVPNDQLCLDFGPDDSCTGFPDIPEHLPPRGPA